MKTTIDVYTLSGEKDGTLALPETIFGVTAHPHLIAQAIRVYVHNQRQGTAIARDRGDVHMTKAKMYRQKGTGRARHGAKSAPVFVGGGVAHGPSGTQNYHRRLSKTMRRQALFGILSGKMKENAITVIKGLEKIDGKTKTFSKIIKDLKLDGKSSVLLLLDKPHTVILRATSSLKQVDITQVKRLNPYEIMNHPHLLLTPESVEALQKHYGKEVETAAGKE